MQFDIHISSNFQCWASYKPSIQCQSLKFFFIYFPDHKNKNRFSVFLLWFEFFHRFAHTFSAIFAYPLQKKNKRRKRKKKPFRSIETSFLSHFLLLPCFISSLYQGIYFIFSILWVSSVSLFPQFLFCSLNRIFCRYPSNWYSIFSDPNFTITSFFTI